MTPTHTEPRLERAIVLQLLRDDHGGPWSREELGVELNADAEAVEKALRALGDEGVLRLSGERVSAARATRRLDELGLIGI
jgi:predicted transcriptional regulator